MINSDLMDYSDNFIFIKSFLDEVFKSVNIGKIAEDNKFVNLDKSLIANDYLAFNISNKNSIKLTFFIIIDTLRIDILDLPEIIEYSIEDIKNNYNKIFNEIKCLLTSKCLVSKRCGCYRIKFIDNKNNICKNYSFGYGFLAILTFCICPFSDNKTYKPITEVLP